MAKLIEFCGAPGVGKSAVYNEVSAHWKDTYRWMPAHKIFPHRKISHPVKKLLSIVLNQKGPLDESAMRKAGSRFVALYPALIDDYWCHLVKREKVSINKTDQRFEKASHVFKNIQRVQTCRESLAAKIIIIEEGLINGIGNALHRGTEPSAMSDEIKDLYEKLPLPEALVFFEADTDIILQRLMGRKRIVPSLENLRQNDLRKAIAEMSQVRRMAVEIYQEKGFPVLNVNGADSVAQNAGRIREFLEKLN
jgi:hypothetical protein